MTVNEATGNATFKVTLNAASGQTVTVGYATSNGTATAPSDYTSTSGTLTFTPGTLTQTISVPIINDTIYEGSETFNVILSGPSNATISTGTGVGTIKDDGTGTGGTNDDRPVNTLPATYSTPEDTTLTLSGISVSNPDPTRTVTEVFSVGSGTLNLSTAVGGGVTSAQVTGNGTGTVTITATVNAINATLANANGLKYVQVPDANGTVLLTMATTDGIGVDTNNSTITITPVADITNDTVTTNEDTPATFNVITGTGGATADSFEGASPVVTAINGAAFTAGSPIAITGGTITVATNGTVTYAPTANYNGSTNFTYTVTSGGVTETATVTLNVTPVNDAPVNTVPGAQTTPEDTAKVISGVSVADIDSAALTTTLTITNGTASVTTGGATIGGNQVIDGDLVRDGGTDQRGVDWPDLHQYSGLQRSGADHGGDQRRSADDDEHDRDHGDAGGGYHQRHGDDERRHRSELQCHHWHGWGDGGQRKGVPGGDGGLNGAAFTAGSPIAITGGTITVAANGTVTYAPTANFNGSTNFSYTVTSGGVTETATVTLNVTPVNDAPVNTVPGVQTTPEDTAKPIFGVSVADVDGDNLTTTLTITNGTASVATGGGAAIGGNGTSTVTLSGTAAQINAALTGLTYTNTPDYNGPAQITMATSDGIAAPVTSTIRIAVTPMADITNDLGGDRSGSLERELQRDYRSGWSDGGQL